MPPFLTSIIGSLGIKGFALIGAAIALAVCWFGWSHAANQRDDELRRNGELTLKLETSNNSIDDLTKTIETLNAEANARAEAFEQSQQEAAREAEALERAARRSDAQIASLRRLAANGGQCEVPGELGELLEGL